MSSNPSIEDRIDEAKIHREIAEEGASANEKDRFYHHHHFKTGLSLFLTLLFVFWIVSGYPVGNIIAGQLESTQLEDGKLKLDEFTIEFSDTVHSELLEIYYLNQQTEFSVCLSGQFEENGILKDKYLIDGIYIPQIYEQTFNHVTFEACSNETLIMLHSHPYKSCLASDTDLNTLEANKETNSNLLMVVMCEPDRFSVYS